MAKFAFYSTEIAATTDPANADPAPVTLVVLDQDPLFGEYDPAAGSTGRGSVIQTLGGTVVQDFGKFDSDGRITLSDTDALTLNTVTAVKALHAVQDGEYFFTDGYEVWKVKFDPVSGFKTWRNLLFAYHGEHRFSYEIHLMVTEKSL